MTTYNTADLVAMATNRLEDADGICNQFDPRRDLTDSERLQAAQVYATLASATPSSRWPDASITPTPLPIPSARCDPMTDESTDDTLAWVRAAAIQNAPKDQKIRYLYDRGWDRISNNKFQSRNGITATFANAVALQIQADMESG
jgi:hypothetical protein